MYIVSIDIGSTFTKGACFTMDGDALTAVSVASLPTTTDMLSIGFNALHDMLMKNTEPGSQVFFSSSAKGGLSIVAIGVVPEMSMKIASLAALSAGGKVVRTYSYNLNDEMIGEITSINPDIIILSGGTDGGHEKHTIHNAGLLARSSVESSIIYAGNKHIADEISSILAGKKLHLVENIMPEYGVLNISPAREAIRSIFLEKIVRGRGLDTIIERTGAFPLPTPLSVFALVDMIPHIEPSWNDFCVVDPGGATTDFYSNTESFTGSDGTWLKGIREPQVKRSVEGDLGLRANALSVTGKAGDYISEGLRAMKIEADAFNKYIKKITQSTDYRGQSPMEKACDALLARACVRVSAFRHAGRLRATYTPTGKMHIQEGKDLRRAVRIIGTGGFLSRGSDPGVLNAIEHDHLVTEGDTEALVLLPEKCEYFIDQNNLFPLLGNLVGEYPEAAVKGALRNLRKV